MIIKFEKKKKDENMSNQSKLSKQKVTKNKAQKIAAKSRLGLNSNYQLIALILLIQPKTMILHCYELCTLFCTLKLYKNLVKYIILTQLQ